MCCDTVLEVDGLVRLLEQNQRADSRSSKSISKYEFCLEYSRLLAASFSRGLRLSSKSTKDVLSSSVN
jgi:hypothetical protein